MTEFEARLSECLDALTEGRWDVDECLRRYPEHAAALRPMLLAVSATANAFEARPSERFARAARERFLIATGQRLQETMHAIEPDPAFARAARRRFQIATGEQLQPALDLEPAPSFFAAARMRFLMAAHRLRAERAARPQPGPRRIPVFGSPLRAVGGALAALVIFLGFSTYTVASANAALPGDWQYPVKLQTERVRLALAFTDGAKRDVKFDIAEERVSEIQKLTEQGKSISPDTLNRLVDQTQPLVEDATADWDAEELSRLKDVAQEQKDVLESAAPQVEPEAAQQLDEAVNVAQDGIERATALIVKKPDRPPTVIAPQRELTATPSPTASSTAEPSETPAAGEATPGTDGTPATTPTDTTGPTAVPATPTSDVIVGVAPVLSRDNVKYYDVTAGHLRVLVPGAADGWSIVSEGTGGVPPLLKLSNRDGSSLMAISTLTGDMFWYVNYNGKFDEVQMRLTSDGSVFVQDRDVLRAAYPGLADIPLAVMETITLIPDVTPTPEPTETAVPTATAAAP